MSTRRTIDALLDVSEPACPKVEAWTREARASVEVLSPGESRRRQALLDTQVTIGSPICAVVYHTGGILVDHSWLRILGSGHARLPRSLPDWNRGRSKDERGESLGFLLIADDAVGGFYALNGGALGTKPSEVFYSAPDTLRWESTSGMSYTQFLAWSFSESVGSFYASMRWPGWEGELASLHGDQALSFYPYLWTAEGKDVATCSRKPCPVDEIYSLNVPEFPRQLQATSEKS
jgi:hypothetical protein